jgi:hypothetical protein
MTYDVVFHDDVRQFVVRDDFKKFVADTAVDGVNRVLAENKEKVSTDYKILKHLSCKGEKPQLMTVKTKDAQNTLIGNMDLSKAESKLQKDIIKQRQEAIDKDKQAKVEMAKQQDHESDKSDEEEVEQ